MGMFFAEGPFIVSSGRHTFGHHMSFFSPLCRAEGAVWERWGNPAVPANDPRAEGEVASSSAGLGQKQRHCLAAGLWSKGWGGWQVWRGVTLSKLIFSEATAYWSFVSNLWPLPLFFLSSFSDASHKFFSWHLTCLQWAWVVLHPAAIKSHALNRERCLWFRHRPSRTETVRSRCWAIRWSSTRATWRSTLNWWRSSRLPPWKTKVSQKVIQSAGFFSIGHYAMSGCTCLKLKMLHTRICVYVYICVCIYMYILSKEVYSSFTSFT